MAQVHPTCCCGPAACFHHFAKCACEVNNEPANVVVGTGCPPGSCPQCDACESLVSVTFPPTQVTKGGQTYDWSGIVQYIRTSGCLWVPFDLSQFRAFRNGDPVSISAQSTNSFRCISAPPGDGCSFDVNTLYWLHQSDWIFGGVTFSLTYQGGRVAGACPTSRYRFCEAGPNIIPVSTPDVSGNFGGGEPAPVYNIGSAYQFVGEDGSAVCYEYRGIIASNPGYPIRNAPDPDEEHSSCTICCTPFNCDGFECETDPRFSSSYLVRWFGFRATIHCEDAPDCAVIIDTSTTVQRQTRQCFWNLVPVDVQGNCCNTEDAWCCFGLSCNLNDPAFWRLNVATEVIGALQCCEGIGGAHFRQTIDKPVTETNTPAGPGYVVHSREVIGTATVRDWGTLTVS